MLHWEYSESELWRFGNDNVSIYHVFSSIAVGNTVLVFAEARYGDGSDSGCPHDIVMKRSTDGGRSFSESICLLSFENGGCLCNPSPIYDRDRQRVFLFYAENLGNVKTKNYYTFSDDLGVTWSARREITELFETPFNLSGPGHGLCLSSGKHAGRLMMQFWHRTKGVEVPKNERGYCASFLYSDDHGETWRLHSYVGHHVMANESRLSEAEGEIVWSLRTKDQYPVVTRSSDGGDTWSTMERLAVSPAVSCDIGAVSLPIRHKNEWEDVLLLSRASDVNNRRDMEILISYDGGRRFSETFSLMKGDAMPGYSDLCVIGEEGTVVGLVHCRNNHVLFSRISLQALTGGKYDGTSRSVWLQ